MDAAQAVIDERTALVAGMLVNNEIGVIQPVDELRNLAAEQGALFFCDAVQGYGRAPMPSDPDMVAIRSEEHTSELQSLMRISYAVFCLKKQIIKQNTQQHT